MGRYDGIVWDTDGKWVGPGKKPPYERRRWPAVLVAAAIFFAAYAALTIYAPRPTQPRPVVRTVILTTPQTAPSCRPINERYQIDTGNVMACP